MEKKEALLAEMVETKSKHGNVYFRGVSETGGKIIMQKIKKKKNERGEQIWKLFIAQ